MNHHRLAKNRRQPVALKLLDPKRKDPPLTLQAIASDTFKVPQRSNYFTVLWIEEGHGHFAADLTQTVFESSTLLFANPYQILTLSSSSPLQGKVLQFHADFFCIETYHAEVGCNGILFNNRYGDIAVPADNLLASEVMDLLAQMERELSTSGLAHSEVLISLLKILLIKATRLKLNGVRNKSSSYSKAPPPVIVRLIELIEQNYTALHSPQGYASLLSMTPKALGKLAKQHTGRTLSELIRECIIRHTKWQLLHTRSPVKRIAADAGYPDELYFSRVFKRATGLAPSIFRKIETEIRGGRNFSM